jgi:putative transposase
MQWAACAGCWAFPGAGSTPGRIDRCASDGDTRDTYGAPNIHAELADDHGIRVGRKRVARLMRQNGIRGATLRKYVVTTQSDPQAAKAIDLVERRFFADAPD